MKSINIKKVATAAAGIAMLAGAVFAAKCTVPELEKDFFWKDDGSTNVQISIGEQAQAIDGVVAAKLAAMIGSKAYVETTGSEEKTISGDSIDVDCSVTVEGGSASVTLPEASIKKDLTWDAGLTSANQITMTSAQNLAEGEITYSSTDYEYEEKVIAGAGTITLAYDEGNDYHGVSFAAVDKTDFYYRFDWIDNFVTPGLLTETVEINFLGEEYVIHKCDTDEIQLIKGDSVKLSSGQSTEKTVGGTVYTVELVGSEYNEAQRIGAATVEVTPEGGTAQILDLETSGDGKQVGDLYVYLEATTKSYTAGVGGTATLRLGGDMVQLKTGRQMPGNEDWKVKIETSGTNIDYIDLQYDESVKAKDQVTKIDGPNDYFYLEYLGSEMDPKRAQWASTDIYVAADDTDDLYLDELTYTDFTYGDTYTIELCDSNGAPKAFMASNSTGFIGNTTGNGTALNMTEEDIFFVDYRPVRVNAVVATDTASSSELQLSVGYGSDNEKTETIKGSSCTASGQWLTCTSAGSLGITVKYIYNDTGITGDLPVQVHAGADQYIRVENSAGAAAGTIDFTHMDGQSTEVNGPSTVVIKDQLGTTINVKYYNTSSDPGINCTSGGTAVLNGQGTNWDYDSNSYHQTNGANFALEDLDGDQNNNYVKVTLPEQSQAMTQRVVVTKEAVTVGNGTEAGTYTPDNYASPVTEFTCVASDKTYTCPAGVEFGTISDDLVVLDKDAMAWTGNKIVIGGHYVHKLADGVTDTALTQAGDEYCAFDDAGTTFYAAGYLGTDTQAVVDKYITAIEGLFVEAAE
jgi:hypothetical protein